jgi:uncharacterized protein YkwD
MVRKFGFCLALALCFTSSIARAQQCPNCQRPGIIPAITQAATHPLQTAASLLPCPNPKCDCGLGCKCVKCVCDNATDDEHRCLAEVNARRKLRGLKPYTFDADLMAGAKNVAQFRADRLMFSHTGNDFAGLPKGATAKYAGCAAYPASYGFLACAMYERDCTRCGCARVKGKDGKMYCHLFVR